MGLSVVGLLGGIGSFSSARLPVGPTAICRGSGRLILAGFHLHLDIKRDQATYAAVGKGGGKKALAADDGSRGRRRLHLVRRVGEVAT